MSAGTAARTVVLGVGCTAAGDDGFAAAVLSELSQQDLPDGVEMMDGGVSGIDLLADLESIKKLILVDAVRVSLESRPILEERGLETDDEGSNDWANGPGCVPGEVVVFRLSAVELNDPDPQFSLHDLSFGGSLRLARILNLRLPEIQVVGLTLGGEGSIEGNELSSAAREKVGEAVRRVMALLAGGG
jgi:Ni,Fe-hydrogenase maturation factor